MSFLCVLDLERLLRPPDLGHDVPVLGLHHVAVLEVQGPGVGAQAVPVDPDALAEIGFSKYKKG